MHLHEQMPLSRVSQRYLYLIIAGVAPFLFNRIVHGVGYYDQ